MSVVEITRVEDVRAGDTVEVVDPHGGRYVGPARTVGAGDGLAFGPGGDGEQWMLRWASRPGSSAGTGQAVNARFWTLVRATREVPDLPTEPGSVILDVGVARSGLSTQYRIGVCRGENTWDLYRVGGVLRSVSPEEITAWTPAKIVADVEQESR